MASDTIFQLEREIRMLKNRIFLLEKELQSALTLKPIAKNEVSHPSEPHIENAILPVKKKRGRPKKSV